MHAAGATKIERKWLVVTQVLLRIRWLIGIGAFTNTIDSSAMRDCFSSYSREESFRSSICAFVRGGPMVVIRNPSRPWKVYGRTMASGPQ